MKTSRRAGQSEDLMLTGISFYVTTTLSFVTIQPLVQSPTRPIRSESKQYTAIGTYGQMHVFLVLKLLLLLFYTLR